MEMTGYAFYFQCNEVKDFVDRFSNENHRFATIEVAEELIKILRSLRTRPIMMQCIFLVA